MSFIPDTLPPSYFVRELPGEGFRPEEPGGVPLSEPLGSYAAALAVAVEHYRALIALGFMPPGRAALGKEPVRDVTGPRPARARAVALDDAAVNELQAPRARTGKRG